MAETGNPASISDAGVGVLAARAAVLGAGLNVRINAAGLKDCEKAQELVGRAEAIEKEAKEREAALIEMITAKIQEK